MRKIPTVYVRDWNNQRYVTDEVTPGCEWVLAGEGVPTRKYDGTCVMFDGQAMWARREVKLGSPVPANFQPVTHDEVTGKTMGWEPVEQSSFAKFVGEALPDWGLTPGTYELVGPKINGNPEHLSRHELIPHGILRIEGASPAECIAICRENGWEGVVWHHPDGRMAKLKVRDIRDGEGNAS